jgi:hypothetical protein
LTVTAAVHNFSDAAEKFVHSGADAADYAVVGAPFKAVIRPG